MSIFADFQTNSHIMQSLLLFWIKKGKKFGVSSFLERRNVDIHPNDICTATHNIAFCAYIFYFNTAYMRLLKIYLHIDDKQLHSPQNDEVTYEVEVRGGAPRL